ncbi:MAG: phage integrase SAM-like domain-containing protein [Cyclobacteriaceae bacterium]
MRLVSLYQEEKLINPNLSAKQVKELFFGIKPEIDNFLSDLVKYHKEKTKTILAPGALKNYIATKNYLRKFLKKHFHQEDIKFKDIISKFIFNFKYFLRTYKPVDHHKPFSNNGVMKHMERFKKLIN